MLESCPARSRPLPPDVCGKVTLRGALCKRPLTSCGARHHSFGMIIQDTAHYAVYRKAVVTYKLRNAETCDPILADAMWSAWHGTNNTNESRSGVFTVIHECENYDIVEVPRGIGVHDAKISAKHRPLFPQWELFAVDPLCTRRKTKHPKPRHDDIDRCSEDAYFDILESDRHCFELPPPRQGRKKRKRRKR